MDLGGAERTTLEMTRAIIAAGGKAIVATSGGRLAEGVAAAGGHIEIMPVHSKNPFVIWRNVKRLVKVIQNRNVELVHARSRAPAWSAMAAARRCGIPFVTTYHGAYASRTAIKRFANSSMVRADKIIANSQFTADKIAQTYEAVENRIVVVSRGADLKEFSPALVSAERVSALAKSWGISRDPGSFIFLMPARFTEWKGHLLVVEALRQLKTSNVDENEQLSMRSAGQKQNFSVVFIGDEGANSSFNARLKSEISECGVHDMTSFVGHCADMPAAYCLADAVLSPSLRPEAFGRVAVEAGAMGKIAIVADHGGARETVIPGETGLRHKPGDVRDLARVMVNVAAMSGKEKAEMEAKALENVQQNFSTQAMAEATLGVYKSLLEDPRELGR